MGGLLIIYTVSGGAKAVAYTQQLQLIIIIAGMAMAGYMVVHLLPPNVGFLDALHIGGKAGKLNVISTGTDEKGFKLERHVQYMEWFDRRFFSLAILFRNGSGAGGQVSYRPFQYRK